MWLVPFFFTFFSFVYFWLCWVFVAGRAFLQLRCAGTTLAVVRKGLLFLQSTGSRVLRPQWPRRAGAVVMACGRSSHGVRAQ